MRKKLCNNVCTNCEKPCFAGNYPKENQITELSKLFKVFGEKNRLHIVYALIDKPLCVHEIEELLGASQSLVSHQLKILRDAKIVKTEKRKNEVIYSLDDAHIELLLEIAKEHIEEQKTTAKQVKK